MSTPSDATRDATHHHRCRHAAEYGQELNIAADRLRAELVMALSTHVPLQCGVSESVNVPMAS